MDPGSQVGSQQRQAPGDVRPQRTRIFAGKRHSGLRPATSSDSQGLIHTEEVTGSIPVSPTRSEPMSVLVGMAMTGRRGWREDSIYFDHSGACRDPETHRHCPGPLAWCGQPQARPRRLAVAHECRLYRGPGDQGLASRRSCWPGAEDGQHAAGSPGAAHRHHRAVPLRELTAATVRSALKELAATRALGRWPWRMVGSCGAFPGQGEPSGP